MKYIREKKVRFGDGYLDVDLYEMDDEYEPPGKRAKRKRISPPHITAANDRHSRNNLRQLIMHNFGAGDLYLTPTYSGENPSPEEAQRHMVNFMARLKRLYKKYGSEPVAIYVTEGGRLKDENGERTRVHHHVCLNNVGIPREEIEACWKGRQDKWADTKRGYCNCSVIQPGEGERGCEKIAEYLAKSKTKSTEKGARRWNSTRNIRRPVETVIDNKFGKRRTEKLLELVRARNAVKSEHFAELRKILEARYDRELDDLTTCINPITGRVYISARFLRKE